MTQQGTEIEKKDQYVSPLAKEPTYGERTYNFVFNQLLNFWVNLTVSAVFSFWVFHSTKPLPFTKGTLQPRDIQRKLGNWMEKTPFLQGIKDPTERMARAQSMSGTLTLLTPGHFIIIPTVWLGPKIKARFVKFFNQRHYGAEAMDDPEFQQRHKLIEQEARPTIWGALVGRVGSIVATQLMSRTLGEGGKVDGNWGNKLGRALNVDWLKKFPGLDPLAERIGELAGDDIERIAPKGVERINTAMRNRGYNWSYKQLGDAAVDTSGAYNKSVQNLSRYIGQDVLYSAITSITVHPILNFVKKFIPGLEYKPTVEEPLSAAARKTMKIASNPIARGWGDNAPDESDKTPKIKITQVKHLERVADSTQQEVSPN